MKTKRRETSRVPLARSLWVACVATVLAGAALAAFWLLSPQAGNSHQAAATLPDQSQYQAPVSDAVPVYVMPQNTGMAGFYYRPFGSSRMTPIPWLGRLLRTKEEANQFLDTVRTEVLLKARTPRREGTIRITGRVQLVYLVYKDQILVTPLNMAMVDDPTLELRLTNEIEATRHRFNQILEGRFAGDVRILPKDGIARVQ